MKKYILPIMVSLFLFFACNPNGKLPNLPPEEERFNECFGLDFTGDFVYTDLIIDTTVYGNLDVKRSLNDSLYEWSIKRGDVVYIIDTLYCDYNKRFKTPKKYWESDDFFVFHNNCGSPCWYYDIYNMTVQEDCYETGMAFLDTLNQRSITFMYEGIMVHQFNGEEAQKLVIDSMKECLDGMIPIMRLQDFSIKDNTVKCSFKCKDDEEQSFSVDLK